MNPIEIETRNGPLILSMPHGGTEIPADIRTRLTGNGLMGHDTDWWIARLYDFADELDASIVSTTVSRYVIDVNRDPTGRSLYPGRATTGLVPTVTFDGDPLYAAGAEPDDTEIAERQRLWFAPYHEALAAQIERIKVRHGFALLYDCHSIRSLVPRLFDGELPVLNIGTNDGASCAPALQQAVVDRIEAQQHFSYAVNGRFRGGWITRHYGAPDNHVHALQMELAQRAYMRESPPYTFDEAAAAGIRPVLRAACHAMLEWAQARQP